MAALFLCFAIPVFFAMLYHYLCFGSPFSTSYNYRFENNLHAGGFLGLGFPSLKRLYALFLTIDEGILFLFPVCLLFPFGIWHFFKTNVKSEDFFRKKLLIWLMICLISASGLYFVCVPWKSNMASYGPRFFLCAIPFLAIFSYPYMRFLRSSFIVLLVYSIIVNHLFLVKIYPFTLLTNLFAFGKANVGTISLVGFHPSLGELLLFDVIYQSALIFVIFLIPFLYYNLKRSGSAGASPSQKSVDG